jgi:glycosyltransferase involved in cell wall biosynthesis
VITGLSTGGAEMMLYKLLSGLDGAKVESRVVTLVDGGAMRPDIESLRIHVDALGLGRGAVPKPRALWRLGRIVRQFRPDILQGWMYHGNLAATAAAAAAGTSLPVVWNVRSSLCDVGTEKRLTDLVIRAGARLSSRAARIIYVSRESARQHEALGYAPGRRVLIPNGFDTARYAPRPGAREDLRRQLGIAAECELIGHVARYHEMKDHPGLLRAAARILARRPQVRFVLVGRDVDARNPEIARLVAELGLVGRVFILGERKDVADLTPGFDIATSSSAWGEAFPNILGEAMSCGVPCVTTDVGDSAEIVGDTGLVIPPRDPDALARAWESLLSRPAVRARLGQAARERVLRRYSLAAVVGQYEGLYADTVARRRTGAARRQYAEH